MKILVPLFALCASLSLGSCGESSAASKHEAAARDTAAVFDRIAEEMNSWTDREAVDAGIEKIEGMFEELMTVGKSIEGLEEPAKDLQVKLEKTVRESSEKLAKAVQNAVQKFPTMMPQLMQLMQQMQKTRGSMLDNK